MSPDAREFLLAEYQRLGSDLVANESMGDARANLYVTLWAAAIGGTTAAWAAVRLRLPLLIGLVGLAALGVVTLVRLYRRNCHSDRLIDALARIRALMLRDDPALADVLPWGRPAAAEPGGWSLVTVKPRRPAVLQVGLLQMVAGLNAGTAALVWLFGLRAWPPAGAAGLGIAVLLLQLGLLFRAFGAQHRRRAREAATFVAAHRGQDR